jgi:hypothetical protein
MSYLKSSLYYLQDINKFLKDKFYAYGDLNNYVDALYTKEKETMPFLERVIMNKHAYDLNKEKHSTAAANIKSYNIALRICLIVLDVVAMIVICLLMFKQLMDTTKSEMTTIKKVLMFIQFAILAVLINYVLLFFAQTCKNRADDAESDINPTFPAEDVFQSFGRKEGVALYYALKRSFDEPFTSKQKKDIKKHFNMYAPKVKVSEDLSMVKYPTIKEIVTNKDWRSMIDSLKHDITTGFQTHITNVGYTSSYDSINTRIVYSDPMVLVNEVSKQGKSLLSFVAFAAPQHHSLSATDIDHIITSEIVPLFAVYKKVFQIDGVKMKQRDNYKRIQPDATVESAGACVFNCEITDACLIAAYNIPSQKCSLLSNKMTQGTELGISGDDIIFAKDDGRTNAYVTSGGVIEPLSDVYEIEGQTNCGAQCMSMSNCVSFSDRPDSGTCTITTSSGTVELDNLNSCADSNASCPQYKQSVGKAGRELSAAKVLKLGRKEVCNRLQAIVSKYGDMFDLEHHTESIVKTVRKVLGNRVYDSVSDEVSSILDQVREDLKRAKRKQTPNQGSQKYIGKDEFVQKFDSMSYGEFGALFYSIDTLSNVSTTLNDIIQKNLANNRSGAVNIFLKEERHLDQKQALIVYTSLFMCLSYAYFLVHSYHAYMNPKSQGGGLFSNTTFTFLNTKLDAFFKYATPLVIIYFVIVMMASIQAKAQALHQYNRDVLEKNSGNLLSAIEEMDGCVRSIHNKIVSDGKHYSMDTRMSAFQVSPDTTAELHQYLVNTLVLLDNCNLLLEGAYVMLPFPWTDITMNLMVIGVSVVLVLVLIAQINPFGKLGEIRDIRKLASRLHLGISVDPKVIEDYVSENDTILILKIVAFIVFVIVVVLFSQKLLSSAGEYRMGLYNSRYYKESRKAV